MFGDREYVGSRDCQAMGLSLSIHRCGNVSSKERWTSELQSGEAPC